MKCVPDVVSVSEAAIVLLYPQTISREVFLVVSQHTTLIKKHFSKYILEVVPAYASIMLVFDLRAVRGSVLSRQVRDLLATTEGVSTIGRTGKQVEIPVYYGADVAPDIGQVAEFASMSAEQVIALHSGQSYDVYATGFAPGFAYLGVVDARIAMPRKQSPRTRLPAGSVGIAGPQTAIYPTDSPGGWQIIGRTPLAMVDFGQTPFSRLQTGDSVRFKPINQREYLALGGSLA